MLLLLVACASSLICGPGTVELDGACVPERVDADGEALDGGASDGGASDGGAGTDGGETSDGGLETDGGATGDDTGDPVDPGPRTRVWLLAGQSNMVGIGQVTGLPPSLRVGQPDVEIFWSGVPAWRPLEPSSAYSSGSARYTGPETSFGRTLADSLPDVDVKLIKHAVGGTDLASYWHPGEYRDDPAQGAGYRDWLATVDAGLAELDAAGTDYQIAGMIWMQGESDATSSHYAHAYAANMAHLIARVRDDVGVAELPFAQGLIDCLGVCAYRDTVRSAQQAVADADPLVYAIETEDLGLYPADAWHYQGLGTRVMGERFAQVLLGDELATVPTNAVTLTGRYDHSYYGDYMVGWRFTVAEPVVVTDVGIFDLGDNGLAHSSQVAIWETDTQALLTIETVPAWDEADTTLLDGFRLVGVEPLVLEVGDYIIADQAFDTSFDYYVYNAQIEPGSELAWVEGRHSAGSSVAFPTSVVSGGLGSAAWFGAGFRYRPLDVGLR